MEINLPDLPDTDYILVPPKTIFYPPIVEEPYLDPSTSSKSGTGRVGFGRSGIFC